ncbi:MAG: hypothetical protein JSU73_11760 [candidate division WOR-3 bacterium]|nr:MAG: hypothetical protein JSU73_11760 [candidate division WOR-3 bacterium]
MNRFLVPAGAAALLAGCTLQFPGLQSEEPLAVDSTPVTVLIETTYVVEEVPVEVPVYVEEPVYYEEEPVPPETVFVVEEYESYVFVSDPPPPSRPHRGYPRRSPGRDQSRGREPREPERRDPVPEKVKPRPRNEEPEPTPVIEPPPSPEPPKPVVSLVSDDEEKAPDKPAPSDQPVRPEEQAPAKDDGDDAAPAKNVKPVPDPSAEDDTEVAASDTGGKKKSPGKSKDR